MRNPFESSDAFQKLNGRGAKIVQLRSRLRLLPTIDQYVYKDDSSFIVPLLRAVQYEFYAQSVRNIEADSDGVRESIWERTKTRTYGSVHITN